MVIRNIALTASLAVLTACGGTPTLTGPMNTDMATASAALNNARSGDARPEDISRSCSDLGSMASALYARHEEITGEARARQQQASMLSGLADVGISALGAGLGMSGGLSGLRAAGVATSIGSTAANAAIMESSQSSLKEINDTTAIVNRLGEIEKARLAKNCPGGPLSET